MEKKVQLLCLYLLGYLQVPFPRCTCLRVSPKQNKSHSSILFSFSPTVSAMEIAVKITTVPKMQQPSNHSKQNTGPENVIQVTPFLIERIN
jgi:hypothetical protein